MARKNHNITIGVPSQNIQNPWKICCHKEEKQQQQYSIVARTSDSETRQRCTLPNFDIMSLALKHAYPLQ